MIAQSHSLSRPEAPRFTAAAFVAVVLLFGAWLVLHVGFYSRNHVLDTPVYQAYGNAIARGSVPYRDFPVEYPPGALPVFALPGLAKPGHGEVVTLGFKRTFETIIWLCGAGTLLAMTLALRALRAERLRGWAALGFAALAPLALGSVVLGRFDLWPAFLITAALAALLWDRLRLGCAILGVAVSVKIFPVVLLPPALLYAWRREGRREAIACLGTAAAAVVVVFAPFVALAPAGVWHSLTGQLTRPLQIESLGSGLLLAAHHVWGHPVTLWTTHGSQNLAGHGAHVLSAVLTAVQAAALVGVWTLFARGPATRERLVWASAAALTAFVALGKVLSPQFLIWLIPAVPLVRGRRGLWASGLLALAMVLTQLWFPFRYWKLALQFDPAASWLVLGRDVVLLALLAVLALPRRDEERAPAPGVASAERTPADAVTHA